MRSPSAISPSPTSRRLRENAVLSTALSRIAATGGMRPALRAGTSADSTVTSRPTTSVSTIVRGRSAMPVDGMSMPNALSSVCRPVASRMPPTSPIRDPTRPMNNASVSIELVTWRRLAPIARISALSRDLWAA